MLLSYLVTHFHCCHLFRFWLMHHAKLILKILHNEWWMSYYIRSKPKLILVLLSFCWLQRNVLRFSRIPSKTIPIILYTLVNASFFFCSSIKQLDLHSKSSHIQHFNEFNILSYTQNEYNTLQTKLYFMFKWFLDQQRNPEINLWWNFFSLAKFYCFLMSQQRKNFVNNQKPTGLLYSIWADKLAFFQGAWYNMFWLLFLILIYHSIFMHQCFLLQTCVPILLRFHFSVPNSTKNYAVSASSSDQCLSP